MDFKLRGEVSGFEDIAVGEAIRILSTLQKAYGKGRWRKLKGNALVELPDEASSERSYTDTKHTALDAEI